MVDALGLAETTLVRAAHSGHHSLCRFLAAARAPAAAIALAWPERW
jgi:hypothetical protein